MQRERGAAANSDFAIAVKCRDVLEGVEPIRHALIRHSVSRLRPYQDVGLTLETDVGPMSYAGSILRSLRPSRLDNWLLTRRATTRTDPVSEQRSIILSDYVTSTIDARLIESDVDYVDSSGNMLIRWPGKLYIHRSGLRPEVQPAAKSGRLLKAPGLQILFLLLADPDAAAMSYRELAEAGGVALGTTSIILNELRQKGFLVRRGSRSSLKRRRELLDLWVTGYSEQLRPRLTIERYQAPDKDLLSTLQHFEDAYSERSLTYAVTGGLAADALTGHYRGNELTLFVSELPRDVVKAVRLLQSPHGRITVLRLFSPAIVWGDGPRRNIPVAHPLLIYAELLHQGGERERETAGRLYSEYLTRLIDTDGK